jgi:hypothetical protein
MDFRVKVNDTGNGAMRKRSACRPIRLLPHRRSSRVRDRRPCTAREIARLLKERPSAIAWPCPACPWARRNGGKIYGDRKDAYDVMLLPVTARPRFISATKQGFLGAAAASAARQRPLSWTRQQRDRAAILRGVGQIGGRDGTSGVAIPTQAGG